MVGSDDAFLTTIVRLLRILPVFPLFGSGDTRLQSARVEDVAETIAQLASGAGAPEFFIKTNGYLRYAFAVADRSISISVPPAWMYSTSLILGGLVAVLR
jgi:NADH dehydrogenase